MAPGNHRNSGISRAFWTLSGNLAYAFFQWGILAITARLGSPELVGRFAIGLAIVAPIMMFTSFQLRQLQVTDTSRHFFFGDFSSARILMSGAGILAVGVSVAIAGFDRELIWITMLLAIWRALELASDLCFGQFQQDDRLDLVGKSNLIRAVLFIFLFSGTLSLTRNLVAAVAALAGGSMAMLLAWDLPKLSASLQRHGESPWHVRWHWHTTVTIFWQALPLGLIILIASLEINMPRYFVHSSLGHRDLGIFAALATTTMAMQTVVVAVNQSALTPLARAWLDRDHSRFRIHMIQLTGLGLAFGVAGIIAGLALGKPLLTIIFGSEYAERNDLFVLLLTGFALLIIVHAFQTAARAMNQNWWPLSVRVISIGATTAACFLLIPSHQLHGAAWAVLIGAGVGALTSICCGVCLVRHQIRNGFGK